MYNFQEAALGPDFALEKLKEFKRLVDAGLSFVVLSMPGVGVSYFLKYLASQGFARSPSLRPPATTGNRRAGLGVSGRASFIHVDLYSLPVLNQHEFYKLLLVELGGKPESKTDESLLSDIKKSLMTFSLKREKIVIIFSRFDQLKDQFDWNFLSNIQGLTTIDPGKIVLIFTSIKPLYELAPDALTGGNLNFYSESLYFKPYSKEDLRKLLQNEPTRPGLGRLELEKLLDLAGGHNQLLRIMLSSQKEQLLLDRFVKLQMKELIDYLDYHQRKTVQNIALGKTVKEIDDYLLNVGMVKKVGSKFELFTSLLSGYIKTNLPVKLPVKEAKLFKLLRQHLGQTVSKDEIFAEVWGSSDEGLDNATDWALDALIYRLRKHPFMKANGYIIESQKKVGYTLIQT